MWADRGSGMVRLSGAFDPERGQALITRLRDEVEARFHTGVPETAPVDPFERQDHLRALAFTALVLGGPADDATTDRHRCGASRPAAGSSGAATRRRPETITVIDRRTATDGRHDRSYVDLGVDGLDLPLGVIVDRASSGQIVPVLVDDAGVVVQVGDPHSRSISGAPHGSRTAPSIDTASTPAHLASGTGEPRTAAVCRPRPLTVTRGGL